MRWSRWCAGGDSSTFHEPWLVWSSAFRRLDRPGPAEAGTPSCQRFHGPNARSEKPWGLSMSKRFRRGLVVGKFAPLHRGHELVIRRASDACEEVVIISYCKPEFAGCDAERR